jgi:hypothetical protein
LQFEDKQIQYFDLILHVDEIDPIEQCCPTLSPFAICGDIDPYNTQWQIFTGSSPNWGLQSSNWKW